MPDIDHSKLVKLYSGFRPSVLSYATAQDYCDSLDTMESLATSTRGGLKDVTRPWIVKAIIGSCKPGARLLEFGAGEPYVASCLSKAGYQVTIVDPFDGRSGGRVAKADNVVEGFPDLNVISGIFQPNMEGLRPESFDVIYSISVLEHLDVDLIAITTAIAQYLAKPGRTIHTIDYALQGSSATRVPLSQTRAREICGLLGVDPIDVDELHEKMVLDVNTYIEPVYSHWRRYKNQARRHPFKRWTSLYVNTTRPSVRGSRSPADDPTQPVPSGPLS